MSLLRPLVAGVLALASFGAAAETLTCTTISALPATISAPGTYCLASNLSTSATTGNAITINANDVRLDCNHHVISNSTTNWMTAIRGGNRQNVSIENCGVRNFLDGIRFDPGSYDLLIRNNRIRQVRTYGILIWGSRIRVLDNSVLDMHYESTTRDFNQGIYISPSNTSSFAYDVEVRGNRVIGMSGTTNMQAIRLDKAISPIVRENHIGGLVPKAGGQAYGVMTSAAVGSVIAGNIVTARNTSPVTGVATDTTSICAANIMSGVTASGLTTCGTQASNIIRN